LSRLHRLESHDHLLHLSARRIVLVEQARSFLGQCRLLETQGAILELQSIAARGEFQHLPFEVDEFLVERAAAHERGLPGKKAHCILREAHQTPTRLRRPATDELSAVLARLDVPLGVPEAQGLACGLLCSRPATNAKSRWFAELLDAAALVPEALAERAKDLHILDAWFGAELAALNDSELDFALALPDDDRPLDTRVIALGEFCAGVVYGVGIGIAAQGNPSLPADTRELLEDFMAIDGADTEADAEDGGEAAFVELSEYVRVGVLLIHEELKPVTASPGREAARNGTGRSSGNTVH